MPSSCVNSARFDVHMASRGPANQQLSRMSPIFVQIADAHDLNARARRALAYLGMTRYSRLLTFMPAP